MLLDEINSKCRGKFDYFYLPIDLKTGCNAGYAFINFTHPFFILEFFLEFQDFQWCKHFPESASKKECKLAMAHMQGKEQLFEHHQNKNIMAKSVRFLIQGGGHQAKGLRCRCPD